MSSVLDDFLGLKTSIIGDQNLIGIWQEYNKAKLSAGLQKSQNTIEELKASTEMLRTQNEAIQRQAELERMRKADIDLKKYLPYVLAAGGLYLAYKLFK